MEATLESEHRKMLRSAFPEVPKKCPLYIKYAPCMVRSLWKRLDAATYQSS